MQFIFEFAPGEPCNFVPKFDRYGYVNRVRFLWFSIVFINLSFAKYTDGLIRTAMKFHNHPELVALAKEDDRR